MLSIGLTIAALAISGVEADSSKCFARGYESVGCDTCRGQPMSTCSSWGTGTNCCGTDGGYCGQEWQGSTDGSKWVDTCKGLDFIRITPGCSMEVSTGTGGTGQKFKYHSSAFVCGRDCEMRPSPGCDKVRSIRLFETPSLTNTMLCGFLWGETGTWVSAQARCHRLGGELPISRNATANAQLMDISRGKPLRGLWLGLTDAKKEGSWVWVDEQPLAYSNWARGEPNNYGGNEDHASMFIRGDLGKWNDLPNNGENVAIACCGLAFYGTGEYSLDYWKGAAKVSSMSGCSEKWCTSPDGKGGGDCWAGSSAERCTCSQGKARMTGQEAWFEDQQYYQYTCCTSGDSVGETCGDCCSDEIGLLIGLIFWILVLVGGILGCVCGVYCCYVKKCCCWQEPRQQPVGYPQGSPQVPQGTVVGQPVLGQPVFAQPVQATVVVAGNCVETNNVA